MAAWRLASWWTRRARLRLFGSRHLGPEPKHARGVAIAAPVVIDCVLHLSLGPRGLRVPLSAWSYMYHPELQSCALSTSLHYLSHLAEHARRHCFQDSDTDPGADQGHAQAPGRHFCHGRGKARGPVQLCRKHSRLCTSTQADNNLRERSSARSTPTTPTPSSFVSGTRAEPHWLC